jgi:hypothetical protein
VYRYNVVAQSDEVLLNQKALPNRSPFVDRSAGNALQQLAQDLLPGWFGTSAVQDVDTLASYAVNPQMKLFFSRGGNRAGRTRKFPHDEWRADSGAGGGNGVCAE